MIGNGKDWRSEAQALADRLAEEGIGSAMRETIARVPRHVFLPEDLRDYAYEDRALPIGHEQTISQPFVVAFMSELLAVGPGDRVLEVGTGSGYQTAVLAELGADVYSVEIVEELSTQAAEALRAAGYPSVQLHIGGGADGWPEHAPYKGIIVTAAANAVPPALLEQLGIGGRTVIPLEDGAAMQWIWKIQKRDDGSLERERSLAVRFVPMKGRAEHR